MLGTRGFLAAEERVCMPTHMHTQHPTRCQNECRLSFLSGSACQDPPAAPPTTHQPPPPSGIACPRHRQSAPHKPSQQTPTCLSKVSVSTSTCTSGAPSASDRTAAVRAMQGRSSLRLTGNHSPSEVNTRTVAADRPAVGRRLRITLEEGSRDLWHAGAPEVVLLGNASPSHTACACPSHPLA